MLLVARGSRWSRRRSAGCRWGWGYVPHIQPLLPSIALTTKNCGIVSLLLYRISALDLISQTPFSIAPQLITYSVRGNLSVLGAMVAMLPAASESIKRLRSAIGARLSYFFRSSSDTFRAPASFAKISSEGNRLPSSMSERLDAPWQESGSGGRFPSRTCD
jgi:hypothetical protein